ncbi:MAG: calcium-binding protein, partial [Acidimicrobiia bacterium]
MTFTSASEAEAGIRTEEWDLDGDGSFDDATGSTAARVFTTPGAHRIGLRVTDFEGRAATEVQTVNVSAATVSVGFVSGVTVGKSLIYTAQNGARNELVIARLDSTYRVSDAGTSLVAGAGCSSLDAHTVSCAASGIVRSDVWLADLDDQADLSPTAGPVPVHAVLGGAGGDDRVRGGSDGDQLHGGEGDDVLDGLGGDDWFVGGQGDDVMHGGDGPDDFQIWFPASGSPPPDGADVIDGGDGIDHARYTGRFAPVRVTIGDGPNDGDIWAIEGDDVRSTVEDVTGGENDDELVGSPASNVLDGQSGDDQIHGGDGDDLLEGSFGDDRLDGGGGADRMGGGHGTADTALYSSRDRAVTVTIDDAANDGRVGESDNVETDVENLTGGSGDDKLVGNHGEFGNVIRGGRGKDRIDGDGIELPSGARDELFGERGDDRIEGGSVWGSSNGGAASVSGGPGADAIDTRGATEAGVLSSVDTVSCGSEEDIVTADLEELIAADCELVARTAPPANESPPETSGTPRAGETLTASSGSWGGTAPITYRYQWRRCDSGGGSCSNLSGETAQRYTLSAADVGHALRVDVRAANAAGSETATSDPTQEIRAQAPDTTITDGPAGKTYDTTPTFTFSSSEADSSFQCRMDADPFGPCASPHTAPALAAGAHIFEVRATDAAGNDPTPAARSFQVAIATCYGEEATIIGTVGNDTLHGTAGPDVIVGLKGHDEIDGGDGEDLVCGTEGDDRVSAGAGADRVRGGPGVDVLLGDAGTDTLAGDVDNDTLRGGTETDNLTGAAGND